MKNSVQLMSIGAMLAALTAQGDSLTREQIDGMLLDIAKTQPSRNSFSPGATCYKMAMPRKMEYEYVCKTCGTHTVHPAMSDAAKRAMEAYEKAAEEFRAKGLDIRLDSSALCRKCHPEEFDGDSRAEDHPGEGGDFAPLKEPDFCWVVKVGGKASRVSVERVDVALLRSFLDKKEPVDGGPRGEMPIQMYIDRLCKLLGAENADELKALAGKLDLRNPGGR